MVKYSISVRDLISFNTSEGSLGGGVQTSTRALIGSTEHRRIQNSRGDEYQKEYSLKTLIERDGYALEIFGRADGIYSETKPPIIEEIKTTTTDNVNPDHMAQVKLYAYLYLIELRLKGEEINEIGVKLLYVDIRDNKEWEKNEVLTKDELELFFLSFVNPYLNYLSYKFSWTESRNKTLLNLKFPFNEFRPGQREFSIAVYRSIRDSGTLFARAPTGTGKSMATIFPALKNMGEGQTSKLFYLTAKTIGRVTARNSVNLLRENGCRIKSIIITAKEKSCINDEFNCDPEKCKFANGYYSRLKECLEELHSVEDLYEENIRDYGVKYTLCPFELSLDLSLDSDIVICDYNYAFDIRVQLKRFFEGGKQDFTLLIDEAHNLPDRLRNSYSCKLVREDLPPLISVLQDVSPKVKSIVDKINDYLLELNSQNPLGFSREEKVPKILLKLLRNFTLEVEKDIINRDFKGKNLLLDQYFNALFFIKLSELYTDGHIFLINNTGGKGIYIEIYCVDPSELLSKQLQKTSSHIFFSATLEPITFYGDMLLKNIDYKYINIPSPFKKDNLKLIVRDDIKTTYKERGRYYQEVANLITDVINVKEGNYLVFFPSYNYLNEVYSLMNKKDEINIQEPAMDENMRAEFLAKFENSKKLLSFAIMGGIFGEGIDLVGDKLIGVIIVGTGLPQISYYGDLIKDKFNYNYAYTFPGFNKVLQGVGRVIRHEEDRGVAILVDSRFNTPLYKSLFPYEWENIIFFKECQSMVDNLNNFWFND